MSVVHKIISKQPLETSRLNDLISTIDDARYEDRGEGTFCYWIDGKSTRGLEVTLEQEFIEVRNMALSNRYDYELTNKIVAEILVLTDGTIFNEYGEPVSDFPIWNNGKIAETEVRDCEVVLALLKEHEVSIFGPMRQVHFGKRLYKKFKSLKGKQLKNKMFDLILTVNYQLPLFKPSGIMRVSRPENDDEGKIMKFLSEETDYILDKYDYILLHNPDNSEKPIMVTNDILNTILPPNWILIDEYTVVAPSINKSEWKKLLTNAKKYDLWESFNNS